MDALFKIAFEALEGTWANRSFIATVAIVWQLRSQRLLFNGMFDVQKVEIKHIDEKAQEAKKESSEAVKESRDSRQDSKEALEVSNKALKCATIMGKRVTEIGENVEEFLSGKHEGNYNEKRSKENEISGS